LKPKWLLHVEAGAVLVIVCLFYQHLQASWLWFALLFLFPDLAMLGYLANKTTGALIYNLFHTYTAPILALVLLSCIGQTKYDYTWLILIWLAHIALDRLIGYGLKYETNFKETHLQRV
jgi:uncharacterized protein DUF4260